MISKEAYAELRTELDHDPSVAGAIGTLLMNAVTIGIGLWLLQWPGVVAYIGASCLLAIGAFQAFGTLHDCAHESFSTSRRLNAIVGHLVGPFCFLPYYSWKHIHQQHHAWAGHTEMDPAVRVLHAWRRAGKVPGFARFAWRSWLPIVALIQQGVFWLYPLQLIGKPDSRKKLLECVGSVAVLVALYAGLALLAHHFHLSANILLGAVLYLFLVELVNVPHHSDFPGYGRKLAAREQSAIARSCYYPPGVSEFLVLNFNFHAEHHLFPRLPWYRLRAARRLVKPVLGAGYTESVGIAWNLKQRTRDMQDVMLVPDEPAPTTSAATVVP